MAQEQFNAFYFRDKRKRATPTRIEAIERMLGITEGIATDDHSWHGHAGKQCACHACKLRRESKRNE